jgi:eukaryotic-like serine/threonine-protein kinase
LDTDELIAGHYRCLRKLGVGGMADILAAEDTETGEIVALKLLHDPVQEDTLDRRLLQELLAAAQVKHPNLVPILDFGVDHKSHRPFFVMELLDGEDLGVLLQRDGPCTAEWLLPLFCAALDGLDLVHRRGIIHKDIKPPNLFVDRKNPGAPTLRVMDFGIAHQMESSRITQAGGLACTPRYTAPEYFMHSKVTPASDVYQMGLVLGEALLGWAMAPEGSFAEAMRAHINGTLRLPPGIAGSPIGVVLMKALSSEPERRHASASQFAAELRQLDPAAAQAAIDLHGALYRRAMQAA